MTDPLCDESTMNITKRRVFSSPIKYLGVPLKKKKKRKAQKRPHIV